MSVREKLMRKGVKADERKSAFELFYYEDFFKPLYLKHAKGYVSEDTGNLKKVDMGIAL